MVTAGANMAFMHAVLAISEPGDEIILPVPFYFNHEMAIQMAGCRAVAVPTDAQLPLRPRRDRPRDHAPHARHRHHLAEQPDGRRVPATSLLREVNNLCRDRGLYHITDEAYEYFTYGSRAAPVARVAAGRGGSHDLDLLAVEGVRLRRLADRLRRVPGRSDARDAEDSGHDSDLPDRGGRSARLLAALEVGRAYCDPHVRELATIRQIVLDALGTLGPVCDVPPAEGAIYCFPRIATDLDAMTLTERLIREHRVAVTPGSAFGMTDGCYFRVAFGALQRETVAEGIGRLVAGLRAICG